MDSQFIYDALNTPDQGDFVANGVSIDSRTIDKGALFIAISGDNFDGHDFVNNAQQKGAVAAIVERPIDEVAIPQIIVGNTQIALQQLAHAWRKKLSAIVIGITGSNGKTSVKEMTRAALRDKNVHATAGNFNNLIGLPLTILAAPRDCEILILEMGMSIPGEMAQLSSIAMPDVVCITNAANAHTEGVGGLDGVRREKASIMDGLSPNGRVVLNADDDGFSGWSKYAKGHEIISFGINEPSDFRLVYDDDYYVLFDGVRNKVDLNLKGQHSYLNATCSCAIAYAAIGQDPAITLNNLAYYKPVRGRLNYIVTDGLTLIDDTYNANPASVKAAIDVLEAESGNRILVLGDMAELGKAASALHDDVFNYAADKNIQRIYGLGPMASASAERFTGKGFNDISALINDLIAAIDSDSVVLVKGSRSMQMERVVAALCEAESKESLSC